MSKRQRRSRSSDRTTQRRRLWSRSTAQVGAQNVAIKVDDGVGGLATQSFTVVVAIAATSQPPVITSTPTQTTTVNQLDRYRSTVRERVSQTITCILLVHSDGMTVDATSGLAV